MAAVVGSKIILVEEAGEEIIGAAQEAEITVPAETEQIAEVAEIMEIPPMVIMVPEIIIEAVAMAVTEVVNLKKDIKASDNYNINASEIIRCIFLEYPHIGNILCNFKFRMPAINN